MSSACVCDLHEWCFYCNMYSPLEEEVELLRQEVTRQHKKEVKYLVNIEQLKADKAALLECLKFYADETTYDLEHLSRHGFIIIDKDSGVRARECLSNLGGSNHASRTP